MAVAKQADSPAKPARTKLLPESLITSPKLRLEYHVGAGRFKTFDPTREGRRAVEKGGAAKPANEGDREAFRPGMG